MRLKQYINESDLYWRKIAKDCAPFLKKYGSIYRSERFIWRGSEKSILSIKKITPRQNRKPSDIPKILHDKLDELFKKEFGWKARSEGVFCTGDSIMASGYGATYIFLPKGNFKFIWCPSIWDLWDILKSSGFASGFSGPGEPKDVSYIPGDDEYEEKLIDIVNGYTDKSLEKAMRSMNEITFKCKEYYLVNSDGNEIDRILEI